MIATMQIADTRKCAGFEMHKLTIIAVYGRIILMKATSVKHHEIHKVPVLTANSGPGS